DLAAARPRDCRRRLVIGRKNEAIERARLARRVDRMRDERLPCEQPRILAGDPLRSGARGDDAEDRHAADPGSRSSHWTSRPLAIPRFATRPITSSRRRAGMPVPGRFAHTSSAAILAPAGLSGLVTM